MRRRTFLAATLAAGGAATAARNEIAPVVKSRRAVVATESEPAARAAQQVFEAGGNAMDAAAAACIASCMVLPELVDLGGYVAAAVVLDGKTGEVWSLDADSAAPAAATPTMYRVLPKKPGKIQLNENEYGCSVENNANVDGALAVGVPGTMAGIGKLHERWGKLKWAQVVAPSQALLANGFPVIEEFAKAIVARADVLRSMPEAAAQMMPGGKPLRAGEIWHRPDMAGTLKRLASAGWQDFYQGEIARRIVEHVQKLHGILTLEDMKAYQARCTPAVSVTMGDARVYSAALPNGGLTCLSALLMLDKLGAPSVGNPEHWHVLAETLKIAWRDRLAHFGDPMKIDLYWQKYIDNGYIEERTVMLKRDPRFVDLTPGPGPRPSPGTVNNSTADADGNLVAITISHGGFFGSCVTVPGTGITLGHGMCRFDPHPGLPNSVGPGKRPLNNVCPLIVRQRGRDVALGMRGGRRIVSVVTNLAQQLLDGGAPEDVVKSARLHTDGYEPVEVSESMPAGLRAELEKMGHRLKPIPAVGGGCNMTERSASGELTAASNHLSAGLG